MQFLTISMARVLAFVALVSPSGLDLRAVDVSTERTITFNYTGMVETFVVPAGVTSLFIDACGAQGGGSSDDSAGGLGARMSGNFAVTPGQVLSIVVGQQGLLQVDGNEQNSSGGGGGTFVYHNAGPALLVAAAGGGGKCNYSGSEPLHAGAAGQITPEGGASSDGNPGGAGGNGGPAGLFSGNPCAGGGTGWLTAGGGPFGGAGYNTWTGGVGFGGGGGGGVGGAGGFGGGGGGGNHYGGGGGGGGYSGGGGGTDPTHGGGGGSYNIGSSQTNTPGFKTGHGSVTITYSANAAPNLSAPTIQNFPATRLGKESRTATLTIRNIGEGPIDNLSIRVSPRAEAEFQVLNRPDSTLAPGESTSLNIVFSPEAVGKRRASLTILSNAPTKRVVLSGRGLRREASPRFPNR